jgi:hypothetical protein
MTDTPSESPSPDTGAEPEVSPEPADEPVSATEESGPEDTSGTAQPEGAAPEVGESAKPAETTEATPPSMDPVAPPPPVQPYPAHAPFVVPPPPPMFDSFWPEPDKSRAPVALLAALIGGLGAAIFLPLGRPGIGWSLLGMIIAAGLFPVARKAHRKVHIGQILWSVVALLLLAVCTFRAAEWLAALCILSACVAGMLAVSGGRSVRAFGMAAVAMPVAGFRALPWAARGTRELRRTSGGLRIAVSLAVTFLLLLIFGALFAGADDNFANLVSAVMPRLDGKSFFRWTFLFAMFTLACLGAAFILVRPPELSDSKGPGRTLRRWEWALPVGMLVVLFAAFIAVQSTPMFGGEQHVQSTERLTYAGYARSGFWQLMMVTILTLPIIGAAARWSPKSSRLDRNLLRGLAGMLAVLTLIIVASALVRMWSYQNAYGFTVMRLLVQSCELWLGVVYLLVIAAGIRLSARWLPTAVIGTAMAALLTLTLVNPEGLIAERNIARYAATGKLDKYYLSKMSADALPALRTLPDRERNDIVPDISEDLPDTDWRSWNLSRQLAFDQPAR